MRLLAMLALTVATAALQAGERGSPPVEVYDTQAVADAAHISTDIRQLSDGRLVIANMIGMMRFDGARWQLVRHPDGLGGMEHLAIAPGDRVFTSFNGDIGWFADDEQGQAIWHSLAARIPEPDRKLGDILDVSYDATRLGIWVTSRDRVIFIPEDAAGDVRVIGGEAQFQIGALVAGDYWIQRLPGYDLHRVDFEGGFTLRDVPGADAALGQPLWAVTAGEADGEFRMITGFGLLLEWRDGQLRLWSEALRERFAGGGVRDMIRMRDGRYAVSSETLGPILVDAAGAIDDELGADDGVPGNRRCHGLYEDRDGDLWVAQDLSIARIALARGVTIYDETRGLPSANDAKRWHGVLYASSPMGLYRLKAEDGPRGGQFERVLPGIRDLRSLALFDADTMLAANTPLHVITRNRDGELSSRQLTNGLIVNVLEASRFVPKRVWFGHATGVARVERDAQGGYAITEVPGLDTAYYKLAEQDARTLWLADRVDGVLRVDIDGKQPPKHYGEAEGLPAGQVRIYSGPRRVWFTTMLGLRIYDAASDRFVIPPGLPPELAQDRLFSAHEDAQGGLWVRGGAIMNDVFWPADNGWVPDGGLLNVVDPHPTIVNFMREGEVAWAVRANGLMRIDLARRRPLPPPLPPLLVQVQDLRAKTALPLSMLGSLGAEVRDLRFDVAQPALHRPQAIEYRSRLLGYDDDWSDWGGRETSRRVYTNLPDGDFKLEVEAKDSFWRVAAMPPRAISIAPPWWRSTAARVSFVCLALAALWLAARLGARRRQHQLLIRQRELEAEVSQRTQELRDSADELVRKNAQLAEQAERLTEIDRLKTSFFINVGHEFRTPLTLVLGPIDDLLRDTRERFSAHAREQLEMANRNARRVLDLIVELLDVNRFEHGQMRLTRVPTDLQALARRVLAESAQLLERHGHDASFEARGEGPWLAAVDPVQIERCLNNLISNAAKYMARGGSVALGLRRDDAVVEITLGDQGRGIAATALPHVFDRFFQAEGSDRASGYGIGLALVREIVEAHDGHVAVDSTPGVGSCFTLTLPALAASATANARIEPGSLVAGAPANSDESGTADGAARPLVLVVDDHDDLRARARGLLAERFDVIEANDGPSAWNLVRDRLPDLIVCDVMMPGFDGIELTRRLRADADTAAIAVLLLTAKVGSEHATAGLRAGADDYLAKPFDASELLARIDALLARAQRLRLRLAREAQPLPQAPVSESAEQRWRRRLDELIAQHLDDAGLSIEQLADAMHADRSQLFRKCKELLGQSPSEYLRDTRLKRAHALIEQGAGSISEVAYATGFDSLSSFTRAFKSRYAVPPSQISKRRAG